MRPSRALPDTGLRVELVGRWRAFQRDMAARLGNLDTAAATDEELDSEARRIGCYDGRVDAIQRGEPVKVADWEVASALPRSRGDLALGCFFTLEPDGRLVPEQPEHQWTGEEP